MRFFSHLLLMLALLLFASAACLPLLAGVLRSVSVRDLTVLYIVQFFSYLLLVLVFCFSPNRSLQLHCSFGGSSRLPSRRPASRFRADAFSSSSLSPRFFILSAIPNAWAGNSTASLKEIDSSAPSSSRRQSCRPYSIA